MTNEMDALIEQRNRLRQRLRAIEDDYRRGLDADLAEQAQQLENAEVLAAIATAATEELERIERQIGQLETQLRNESES